MRQRVINISIVWSMISKKNHRSWIKTFELKSVSHLTKINDVRAVFFLGISIKIFIKKLIVWTTGDFDTYFTVSEKSFPQKIFIVTHGLRICFETFTFYNDWNCYKHFLNQMTQNLWNNLFRWLRLKRTEKNSYEWVAIKLIVYEKELYQRRVRER